MRFGAAQVAVVALLALFAGSPVAHSQDARTINGKLNTLKDVHNALRQCWVWPSIADSSGNMDLTVMLSFRRNGEMFGGRITHESRNVSDNERALYYAALADMIRRCSPLPVSDSLGQAIAGQPFIFRLIDTRKQKRA
jgi:hypothetical protein